MRDTIIRCGWPATKARRNIKCIRQCRTVVYDEWWYVCALTQVVNSHMGYAGSYEKGTADNGVNSRCHLVENTHKDRHA